MGIFCKHQYGEKIVGKSPKKEWGIHFTYSYIRTRIFRRCKKCGKKKIISDSDKYVFDYELDKFIEDNYDNKMEIIDRIYA